MNTEDKLVIYQAADGAIELSVDAKLETIWASQRQIAEVFGVNVRTVNEHLGNIFDTEELDRSSTVWKFRIVRIEGEREVERVKQPTYSPPSVPKADCTPCLVLAKNRST